MKPMVLRYRAQVALEYRFTQWAFVAAGRFGYGSQPVLEHLYVFRHELEPGWRFGFAYWFRFAACSHLYPQIANLSLRQTVFA